MTPASGSSASVPCSGWPGRGWGRRPTAGRTPASATPGGRSRRSATPRRWSGPSLQFLGAMGGEEYQRQVGRAHDLADRLGDDHDLAVLRGLLSEGVQEAADGGPGLLPLIDRRRGQLQQEAFALGAEVYRERP